MTVVKTALLPPRLGSGIVPRPRLIQNLPMPGRKRMSLVRAPAGYGKTTLLQQWRMSLSERGERTAWLSLDRYLSDIMTQITASLAHNVPEFQHALNERGQGKSFVTTEEQLVTCADCLTELERDVTLFMDDAHLLQPEDLRVFQRFLTRIPANTHIVVASREAPNLALARLRAQGELSEIGMDALKFTAEETCELLKASSVDGLCAEDAPALVDQTEGWAAGLRLATMNMVRNQKGAILDVSLSGSNSIVADFFAEDIFGAQPADVRDFLLATCLLERFTPDLCNAMTGGTDAREMLDRIEAAGLFLIRLDEERMWYRYHGLFAEFLLRRLTDIDPDRIAQSHIMASRSYHRIGLVVEALDHAVRSGEQAWLAQLLDDSCEKLIYEGKILYVFELAKALDKATIAGHPRIQLAIAWMELRNLNFDKARRLIVQAEECIANQAAEGLCPEAEAELRFLAQHRRMMLAGATDDFLTVDEIAETLMKQFDEEHTFLACTVYGQQIRAQRERFRLQDFERNEARARTIGRQSQHKFAFISQKTIVGKTWFAKGDNDAAIEALEFGYGQALDFAGEDTAIAAFAALPLAEVIYERNELSRAKSLVDRYLPRARAFAFADELLAGYLVSARISFNDGDSAGAIKTLDLARSVGLELGLKRMQMKALAEKVRILLRSGNIERAARLALLEGIPTDVNALKPDINSSTTDEARALVRARILISEGNLNDALALSQRWKQFCQHRGAMRSLVRWSLIRAQILVLACDTRAAQRSLRDALLAALDGRSVRIFLDEGPHIQQLLEDAYGSGPMTNLPVDLYAYDVLNAFTIAMGTRASVEVDDLADQETGIDGKMTGRELEILSFVASGLRNREIGDRLGLTEGSVKWYMQRIYDKVGPRRRSVAVDRARQFGLLQ